MGTALAGSDGLSLEQIRTVMQANAHAFTGCLNKAVKQNKNFHGPFLYDIVVDKAGKVTAARPFAPSAVASFDTCVVAILKKAKFPGGPANVEAPLVFESN
jgi:hypothetical protein